MADFDIILLSTKDGTWDRFREDWEAQCREVGEVYEEYASDSLSVVAGVVTGTIPSLGGTNVTRAAALWDAETEHFYACFMLNRTNLPNVDGRTLRVRHLLVSPLIDYGVSEIEMYPDVVVGVMLGIVVLSQDVLASENIHFHLRSPEDMTFFRAYGAALETHKVFASVQTRGAWLYINKAGEVGTPPEKEPE